MQYHTKGVILEHHYKDDGQSPEAQMNHNCHSICKYKVRKTERTLSWEVFTSLQYQSLMSESAQQKDFLVWRYTVTTALDLTTRFEIWFLDAFLSCMSISQQRRGRVAQWPGV